MHLSRLFQITQALYDPLQNFENTKERQERLIDTLAKNAIISIAEAENLKAEAIELNVKQKIQQYPAYSTYVLQEELRSLVAYHEGFEAQLADANTVEERNLITLQLDATIDELLRKESLFIPPYILKSKRQMKKR